MIILASQSPRRKELMKGICPSFSIEAADINEESSYVLPPLEAVQDIAYRKGIKVSAFHPNDIVISADTIVTLDNLIIGKPKNKSDAKRILKFLSGKTHKVITAYAIICGEKIIRNYVVSEVNFNCLDDDLIEKYISSGSPMDKAGAYGVQDNNEFHIISSINGSYHNIMGFPVDEIKSDLIKNRLI